MAQPAEHPAREPPAARAVVRAGLLALVFVAAGIALRYVGVADLRAMRPTPSGALTLVTAGALLCAAGLPRQVVAFAGGFVFGAWPGAALSLLAQMLGCGLDYVAARGLAGGWARRRLAAGGRLTTFHRGLSAHPFSTTLMLRLLPVGNNLVVNLLAGVAAVRVVPFLLATCLGYIPQTIIFALLGSGVQVGHAAQLGAAAILFAAAASLGWVLWNRIQNRQASPI